MADQAELWLHIVTKDPCPEGRSSDSDWRGETITGSHDWTRHEVTAQVPGDAELIRFGLTLTGPGQVGLIPREYPAPLGGAGQFHAAHSPTWPGMSWTWVKFRSASSARFVRPNATTACPRISAARVRSPVHTP